MTPERIKELREFKWESTFGLSKHEIKLEINECLDEIERLQQVIKDNDKEWLGIVEYWEKQARMAR